MLKVEFSTDMSRCFMDGEIAHAQGYSKPVRFEMAVPASVKSSSGKEVQNAAQVCGVAMTYCRRYATCNILGIETGKDTDGYTGGEVIDAAQVKEIYTLIKSAKMSAVQVKGFLTWIGAAAVDQIAEDKFERAKAALVKKCEEAEGAEL
jgi:hypothetical protein